MHAQPPTTLSGATLDRATPDRTDLHGRWLLLARVGWWVVATLSLAFFVTGLPGRFAEPALHSILFTLAPAPPEAVAEGLAHLGLSPGFHAAYAYALVVLRAAAYCLAGALLVWRRPAERMALVVALLLVGLVATPSTETYPPTLQAMAAAQPLRAAAGMALNSLVFTLLVWLFLLFPDGHFRPRWTRLLAAGWLLLNTGTNVLPGSPLDQLRWPPALAAGFALVIFGVPVYAQVWRYRRVSGPVERQQAKWVALGLTAALGMFAGENGRGSWSRRAGRRPTPRRPCWPTCCSPPPKPSPSWPSRSRWRWRSCAIGSGILRCSSAARCSTAR